MSVITLVVDLFDIPEGQQCQEASPMSGHRYFACGSLAVTIIDNGDERSYYMCYKCAMHNLSNRGASIIYSTDDVMCKMMRDGTIKVKKMSRPTVLSEGWAMLGKWHFFRSGLSLCIQTPLPANTRLLGAAPPNDSCKNCQKTLAKETP